MDNLDLKELRRLAIQATPGPWKANYCEIRDTADKMIIYDEGGHSSEDAAYIAAANPAVILALLDRVERAEADAERYGKIKKAVVRDRLTIGRMSGEKLDAAVDHVLGHDEPQRFTFDPGYLEAHAAQEGK